MLSDYEPITTGSVDDLTDDDFARLEVGFDTLSFAGALKSALRQDPDVVLVGEMRDFETIETAITAARNQATELYGAEYVPAEPRVYA